MYVFQIHSTYFCISHTLLCYSWRRSVTRYSAVKDYIFRMTAAFNASELILIPAETTDFLPAPLRINLVINGRRNDPKRAGVFPLWRFYQAQWWQELCTFNRPASGPPSLNVRERGAKEPSFHKSTEIRLVSFFFFLSFFWNEEPGTDRR